MLTLFMKTAIKKHLLGWPSRAARRFNAVQAFTLVELLVVIATLAVLSAMLLPALARSSAQPKAAACTANFRQWAVSANLYANDYQDRLPSFDPYGGGSFAWDVGTGICTNLGFYGMTVPTWFCPFRPNELDAANTWVNQWTGRQLDHPIQNINDLSAYFGASYSGELLLRDNYWVPRYPNGGSSELPTDWSGKGLSVLPAWARGVSSTVYGWPKKLHDNAVAHVPFVSDVAASGQSGGLNSPLPASPNINNIAPNTAHFVNGILLGVNAAYADGHVEAHSPSQMRPAYGNIAAPNYWFY
jgi:prepilin-type processing-associated H-X9-DG protein